MATWHYYNENREKIEVRDRELKRLAQSGVVTPETLVENPSGRIALAKEVKGLTFLETTQQEIAPPESVQSEVAATFAEANSSPFTGALPVTESPINTPEPPIEPVQESYAPPPPVDLFCTNCGNSISAQAPACMSCGAKPTGHKKFCRQCGVGLNPEQIVCVKCGANIATKYSDVTTGAWQAIQSLVEKTRKIPTPVIAGIAIILSFLLLFSFIGLIMNRQLTDVHDFVRDSVATVELSNAYHNHEYRFGFRYPRHSWVENSRVAEREGQLVALGRPNVIGGLSEPTIKISSEGASAGRTLTASRAQIQNSIETMHIRDVEILELGNRRFDGKNCFFVHFVGMRHVTPIEGFFFRFEHRGNVLFIQIVGDRRSFFEYRYDIESILSSFRFD